MKNFLNTAIIVALTLLFLNQCRVTAHVKKTNKINQIILFDSLQYFKNKIGLEVAEKLAFKGNNKELSYLIDNEKTKNKQLKEAVKKFKKLASVTKTETIVEIKEVPVPFKVEVPFKFERDFNKLDPFFAISGTANEKGITFKNITIPNTQTLVVGQKKLGLFKTEFRVEVTNSNPHIKTTSLDNFTFVKKEKRFGVGFSFGFGIFNNGFFVGPSINYNLIQF